VSAFSWRGLASNFYELFGLCCIEAFLTRCVYFVEIFYDLCVLSSESWSRFVCKDVGFYKFI